MPSRSPSPVESELLSRLNALKQSSIILDKSPSIGIPREKTTDDLATRFLRFSADRKPGLSHTRTLAADSDEGECCPKDDQTVEELLADLGPDDQWKLDPGDPKHIAQLMSEARTALDNREEDSNDFLIEGSSTSQKSQQNDHAIVADKAMREDRTNSGSYAKASSNNVASDDPKNEETADAEAEAYLQRVLDELALEDEKGQDPAGDCTPKGSTQQTPPPQSRKQSSEPQARLDPLDLPSTPDTLPLAKSPSPSRESTDDSEPLQLPSAPTTTPSRVSKMTKSSLPNFTDTEIETWCVICNDDATVRCIGCDGDLYCAKCWREGHVGPDVGFEEKLHRWVKIARPR